MNRANYVLCCLILGVQDVSGQELQVQVARAAAHYFERKPLNSVPSVRDTQLFRDLYLEYLQSRLGRPVGYKAALTSAAVQRRFATNQPVLGVLLEGMLLNSPAYLPSGFAVRPFVEADLVVRVADEAIETAVSDAEILDCLDAVIPFVEIPDLVYAPGIRLDMHQLELLNAGARVGVLGQAIMIHSIPNALRQLAEFRVELRGSDDVQAMWGKGSELMGHPLRVVRWIRDRLKRSKQKLRVGDLLSLGSITPLQPVVRGSEVSVRYIDLLPGAEQSVYIKFN